MGSLSGKRLTVLGAALILLAAAAAVRVTVSAAPRSAQATNAPGATVGPLAAPRHGPAPPADAAAAAPGREAASGTGPALPAADHVALALSAEKRGELAAALAHYRAAVSADPRCVDRRSPAFLGPAFEEKLKGWIAGMKGGRIAAGPEAFEDASFIFRRMYGGCG